MKKLIVGLWLMLTVVIGIAQNPQSQSAPIFAANAKYVNGVAPGYWPTFQTGLVLNLSSGTTNCSGTIVNYAGGTLTMTASTTNYVYLNTAASCAPAVKTTAFTAADIIIATVVAGPSAITSVLDVRTPFVVPGANLPASAQLLGTTSGGSPQSISLGTNLSLSGTTLNATGGSGISTLTTDVSASGSGSVAATVQGLKNVPFCTGYSPTNGQAPEYITSSSPNPCYGAVTPSLPAGVSSDSNNGIIISGSSKVGTLQLTYKCTGSDPTDGNAINSMLSNGSGVVLTLLGACVDNTVVITMHSGQTIEGARAATLTFSPSSVPSPIWTGMLTNISANESATRTFSDGVTTTGSNTLTSASGAAFVAADAGQALTCTNVLGSSITQQGVVIPNQQTFTIRSVVSGTQIELVDPAALTTSGTSCSIYYRDSHITLRGLKVINNGPNCASGTNDNWWITVFMHVNGLIIQNVEFQNGTTGLTSTAGCKSALISDSSNIRLIDDSALTSQIFMDGFDFFGNVSDVYATGQHGRTGDDMFAIQSTTNGFLTGFPIQGAMHNFQILNSNFGSGTAGLKTYGPDQIGFLPNSNITMSNIKCVQSSPQLNTATVSNMVHGFTMIGGTQDNITVSEMSGNCGNPINLNGTLYHGTFSNISADPYGFTSGSNIINEVANANQTAPIYGELSFEHIRWNGPLTGSTSLIKLADAGAIIGTINISDFQVTNTFSTVSTTPFISILASSLGVLNVPRMGIQYVAGSTANAGTITIGPATGSSTTMALGQVNISDSIFNITSGTDGPNALLNMLNISTSPLISFKSVYLTSATASTFGFLVSTGSTGSPGTLGTPSYLIQNSILSNVSGCFERIQGVTPYALNYTNITSIGNSFSVTTAASCPQANQLATTSLVGATATVGVDTYYDKIVTSGVTAPNTGTPTQVATGGGGSLTDNTTFFYKLCGVNSIGVNCGTEKSILVCPASTCSNLSVVTIPTNAAPLGVQSYNVYRSTSTGTELLCGSLTTQPTYLESLVDTGNACSGAAVPTTNTSIPTIILANASGTQNTTLSGSASTSALAVAMPITSGTIPTYLTGTSGSLGGSSLAAGACSTTTVAITGYTNGMSASATPAANPGAGFTWNTYFSSTNNVGVEVCAIVAGTPTATTYNVRVIQ